MCKVSVIVPVWNLRRYIARCLDSLLSQTLDDMEIICVVDNPTDGTDFIVDEYCQKNNKIKVVRKEVNKHVSESRNIGLSVAKGMCVGFCDHDDFCNPDMFGDLYQMAVSSNADVVSSDARLVYFDGRMDI